MHIIQVITELEPAGAEKILSELSIEFKNKAHKVSVVTLQKLPKNTAIIDKLKDKNIEVYSLNLSKTTPWKIFSLRKLLETIIEKYDSQNIIVHSHLMHANIGCRISKLMGLKIKLINTIHVAEKRCSQRWLFWFDKLTLKCCDVYTAVSSAARDYHAGILNIDKNHIKVINNGIIPPNKPDVEKIINLKREWNISECSKIIGSIGRLNRQKGYDIFFDLLPELEKIIPANEVWGIVLLGEGEERKNLETKIKGIPNNIKIILPGYRKDAAEYIRVFDLFIMPSRYEGMPLTLLEAFSHGIPILTSDIDTISNLIKIYPNGKCIDFEDNQTAVRSILEYIDKPRISDYKLEYTQEKMVSEYISLYNEMLQ